MNKVTRLGVFGVSISSVSIFVACWARAHSYVVIMGNYIFSLFMLYVQILGKQVMNLQERIDVLTKLDEDMDDLDDSPI